MINDKYYRPLVFFNFSLLFQSPSGLDVLGGECFHMVLRLIVKVTEEIDAREGLKITDIDDIGTKLIVALNIFRIVGILVLMLDPESESLIAATVFAEQCHKEIFWDNHLVLHIAAYLVITIDGAALADIEGVAERTAVPVPYLLFHS